MQLAEVKSSNTAKNHIQTKRQPFFGNEGKGSFFSKTNNDSTAFFNPPTIQPKLTIGKPNDKNEVEADAMADKVVRKLNTNSDPISTGALNGNPIQRKCSSCEKEEKLQKKEEEIQESEADIHRKPIFESNAEPEIQRKPDSDPQIQLKCAACQEEEKLQRKEKDETEDNNAYFQLHEYDHLEQEADTIASRVMDGQSNLPSAQRENPEYYESDAKSSIRANTLTNTSQLVTGGKPLNEQTQIFYENKLGYDLSHVRIHTGSEADHRAHSIGAHAFTFKNHIWLGSGQEEKPSFLLAHELIHVLQQTQPQKLSLKGVHGVEKINHSDEPEVQANPFYWVPIGVKKALSGTAIHKEILNKIAEENNEIDREVAIPNADRDENVGFNYKGQADLHQGITANRIGLYFESLSGSDIGKPSKLRGNISKGKPGVNKSGNITGIEDAPTQITLGELKPIDKELIEFGKSQMDSYEKGMEFAQAQTNKWSEANPKNGNSPKWDELSFSRFNNSSYDIPDKYTYDANNPKDDRNLGVGTYMGAGEGVRIVFNPGLKNPVKGGLYAAHADNGIIVYFSRPSNPQEVLDRTNISELKRAYAAYATELQNEIINKLYESPEKVDAFSKNSNGRKTHSINSSRTIKGSNHSSPPRVLRKPKKFKLVDPFDFGKWKKSRKSFSKKFSSEKSEDQREHLQLIHLMYEAEESLHKQKIPDPPKDKKLPPKDELDFHIQSEKTGKKGKKETTKKKLNLTDLYDWMKLWSSSKMGFIGVLRDKFGGTFVKVVEKVNSLKLKLQERVEQAKKKGSKKGNSFGLVAVRAFWRAAAKIGGAVLSNTVGLLVEGLQNGIKNKIADIIPQDVRTLTDLMEKDFEELRELEANLNNLKTEIEKSLNETITNFETEIESLKTLAEEAEKYGKYIKWAMIALNCGTPPLWGCLKVLAKGLMARMVDEILQWCWTQEKFAGIVLSTGWFDSIPGTIAHGVANKVEEFLPKKVKPIFDRSNFDNAARPPASDIPCDEGPTPEQLALAELHESLRENLGDEGYVLLTIAFEKYGVYMDEELTVTEINEIKSRIPGNVTPGELEKFIAAHPRPSRDKMRIVDVAEFLEVVKESAEYNWYYIAHPPKTGHTKYSSVNVEVSISNVQACSGWRELTTVIVPAKVTKRLWQGKSPKRYLVIYYRPKNDFELDLDDKRITLFKDKEFWGYRPDACRIREDAKATAQDGKADSNSNSDSVDIQRKCQKCDEDGAELKLKEESNANDATSPIEDQLDTTKGTGTPLPKKLQNSMGAAFEADFGKVRIHTGLDSIAMNTSLNAQAFTHGNDIYFNKGNYNPNTTQGKHLLAHELTHTLQQSNGGDSIQRSTKEEFGREYPNIAAEIARLSDAYRNLILHVDPIFEQNHIYNITESRVISGIPVNYLLANNAQRQSRHRLFAYETRLNQEELFDIDHVGSWRIFYEAALRHLRPLFIALINLGGETAALGQFYRDEQMRLLAESTNLRELFPDFEETEEVDEGAEQLSAERESGDLRWYLQADIPSPIIRTGTTLTVSLRNNHSISPARRAELAQAGRSERGTLQYGEGEHPMYSWEAAEFGVIDEAGTEYPWQSGTSGYPLEFEHTFNQEGRRIIYFRGRPHFASNNVYAQYTIFVGDGASAPFLEEAAEVTQGDLELVTNEDTGYGELLSLFKSLVARRALEMLSNNKRDAIELKRHYEGLEDNPHAAPEFDPRTGFVFRLSPVYQDLHNHKNRIEEQIENTVVRVPDETIGDERPVWVTDNAATELRRQPLRNRLSQLQSSIAQIEMSYPEVAALRRFENDASLAENVQASLPSGGGFVGRMIRTISSVQQDIDSTRYRIISGELDVMQIQSLSAELRERLVPQNPNIATALNNYHEDSDDLWLSLGLTGASIALLFVPGIGPFISAAVGLAGGIYQAAESWEEAEVYRSGHNAGLRQGVFTEEQHEQSRMQAVMDTLWAVVDVIDFGTELGAAVRILGEISNVRRVARRTENIAEEAIEGETNTLRHLSDEVDEATSLNTPTGVAGPESTDQRRLLQGTSNVEDGRLLTEAELEAEMDIVRRSEIQLSSMAGYTGQVEVGNTHTWRQRSNGTWCRFSNEPKLCVPSSSVAHEAGSDATTPLQERLRDAIDRGDLEAYIGMIREHEVPKGASFYVGRSWDYDAFDGPPGRIWRPGDPIDMPSVRGQYPTYATARGRYWRNRAFYELQLRRQGRSVHDPTDVIDPMRGLTDTQLQTIVDTGTAKVRSPEVPHGAPDRIGRARREVMELEHHGVPQRVRNWLVDIGYTREEARRLTRVSSPESLQEMTPIEHAFNDAIANTFPSRADATHQHFRHSDLGDNRMGRPLSRMDDATIRQILHDLNTNQNLNLSQSSKLRDALRLEIRERPSLSDLSPP